MSAFVVSEHHIDVLVTAALGKTQRDPMTFAHAKGSWCEFGRGTTSDIQDRSNAYGACAVSTFSPDALGSMLLMENHASVSYRYNVEPAPDDYTFHRNEVSAVQVFKAISCLEYQSCEHPAWETSTARAFCEALRDRMIESLPGYDEAEWEVSTSERERREALRAKIAS